MNTHVMSLTCGLLGLTIPGVVLSISIDFQNTCIHGLSRFLCTTCRRMCHVFGSHLWDVLLKLNSEALNVMSSARPFFSNRLYHSCREPIRTSVIFRSPLLNHESVNFRSPFLRQLGMHIELEIMAQNTFNLLRDSDPIISEKKWPGL